MVKGEKRNRLTMISNAYPGKSAHNERALFQCECGNTKEIHVRSVSCGKTKSCGCLQREYAKRRTLSHGKTETRLYRIWSNMKNRCNNPNYKEPQYYKDKGITVCPEWENSFEKFYEWAMSHGYANNLSIDRQDGNKGYSPENCRWVDEKTQGRNRQSNIKITHNGETHILIEWCEILGLQYGTIAMRIRRGWDKERAILEPVRR